MSKSPMTTVMETVERWHNWASDTKFVWFPFLFLKPSSATLITQKRILVMAPCFGLYFNMAYCLKRFVLSEPVNLDFMLKSQIAWTLGFYTWFSVVTAHFWNRRARRLEKKAS